MRRAVRTALVVAVALGSVESLWADQLAITIQVQTGDRKTKTSRTVEQKPLSDPPERSVFEVDQQKKLRVEWTTSHTGKSETIKNVLVHFFVVKQKKLGQENVPKLDDSVLYEGALNMDFQPGDQAQGEFTLTVPKAGPYLLRVETIRILNQHGHEHFAALDLKVQ